MHKLDFQSQLVLSTVSKGPHKFEEIVQKSGGIYPLELRKLISQLIKRGQIESGRDGYTLADPQIAMDNELDYGWDRRHSVLELPEPHPHDCDWRFDIHTSQQLAQMLIKENSTDGMMLLIGTPSVFIELARENITNNIIFVDWNAGLIDYLCSVNLPDSFTLVKHDLLSGNLWESIQKADVVLCDPPWYLEHYAAFLAQAASASRIGATVMLSLLPINTRPTAIKDRWKIFDVARQLGLHLQEIKPNGIRYRTPIFESMSLTHLDIDLAENWRASDIAIFKKTEQTKQGSINKFLAHTARKDQQEWTEVLFGPYKVKLRGPFDDHIISPEIISIEPGDVLPTVSRRYCGRDLIDLWLWDNRVFAIKGKASFRAALQALTGKSLGETSLISKSYLNQALKLLNSILIDVRFQN